MFLLSVNPELGSAGTLRACGFHLRGGGTCVVVAAHKPVPVDVEALVAAHVANGALLTVGVRRLVAGARHDVLIAGEDGRVMAVQPLPHPDEALSDLADAGIYAVAPEALDHVPDGASELTGEVLGALLAWDAPVYVHRLDD